MDMILTSVLCTCLIIPSYHVGGRRGCELVVSISKAHQGKHGSGHPYLPKSIDKWKACIVQLTRQHNYVGHGLEDIAEMEAK